MLTIYFSGTGNTKYVATHFSRIMKYDYYSIEDDVNFKELILSNIRICICYPIYASRMPRILKEFILRHKKLFKDKEIIILVTQAIASGDGARSFIDVFPHNYFKILYAEHINMPNNICNFASYPIKNGNQNNLQLQKANHKIIQICRNIKKGKVIKRGFNMCSRIMGLPQGVFENLMYSYGKKSVRIDEDCISCGLCVNTCPTKNLKLVSGKVKHNNNCTLCYRCVNICPKQSITTLFHKKPKNQYHGL